MKKEIKKYGWIDMRKSIFKKANYQRVKILGINFDDEKNIKYLVQSKSGEIFTIYNIYQ